MGWEFFNAAGFLKTNSGRELVSTLPSSPVDGQEVFYQASGTMATNGVVWHLRYDASSASAYKWEYVGGPPISAYVATDQTRAIGTGYGALATAGPSVTLPLAGDYYVSLSAYFRNGASDGAAYFSYQIGASAASDSDALFGESAGTANSPSVTSQFTLLKTALTAVTLTAQYKATGSSSSATFSRRSMIVTPVRVG